MTVRYVLPPCVMTTLLAILAALTAAGEGPGNGGAAPPASGAATAPSTAGSPATPAPPAYASLLKDAKSYTGMFTLYQKGVNLYAEFSGPEYKQEYIVLIAIARGIGQEPLLGGYSWGFGDDWVWQFRKVEERVLLVRKNVRFRANRGFPEYAAVQNAYTDSVLFSLRILGKGPKGGDLVDLTPVFMSDLPQIAQRLPGFSFSPDRSTWASIKAFPRNVELQVAATYASSGRLELETVPDSRGVTVNVHYSISQLQPTGYSPRLADDRVGYFLTVVKDFSKESERDQFVRYINRWHLEKPPGAKDPPFAPKQSIIFYIEKTVPYQYRGVVREAIEEWNKAFARAGWQNAIEVRQQKETDDWDPEDVNYNTFRWITSNAGFAMGPSRVNPYTGQILDADIIFDADFLQYWKDEFETFTPHAGGTGESRDFWQQPSAAASAWDLSRYPACQLAHGMACQLALGHAAIHTRLSGPEAAKAQEKMIRQGLKEVVMHEVGHTLGLRHNFKGSGYLSIRELNDAAKTREAGMVASIMDYTPANVVPKDWEQGDYYPTTLGPYDYWAIEYGYRPLAGGTEGEVAELRKIASRSGEPALQYATDEDTGPGDPDPGSNRFDLGKDLLEYAKVRAQVVQEAVPGLVERLTREGDDYTQVRRAFNVLLSQHGQAMFFAARYVGGLHTTRSHRGDKSAAAPLTLVDAGKQRAALGLLEEKLFSDQPFQFSPDLYKYLAASHWRHWGTREVGRKDFPLHEAVSRWQQAVLDQLLAPAALERMHDSELKAIPADDVLTVAEMMPRLTRAIFAELEKVPSGEFTERQPAISSLRRNLQREYLRRLCSLALGRTAAPSDCQTLAYAELASIEESMRKLLGSNARLDSYSRAHLLESADRIRKVRTARFALTSP